MEINIKLNKLNIILSLLNKFRNKRISIETYVYGDLVVLKGLLLRHTDHSVFLQKNNTKEEIKVSIRAINKLEIKDS
jgi:hypothetical protein